ncbi:Protein phosphatase 2C [Ruminococcus sp. YRD2003]|uniref:PP2C family serine/threonine-protein phosphatase n=1 Tax=Ruminococcus sp. YRD2003 TaxID=1452313 RepID=UPI0008D22DE1|nr:Protein phosphatase 2C [Ruminococcus flavefaciens]
MVTEIKSKNTSYYSLSCTIQGANHKKNDIECEDASDCFSEESISVCVVADGHGSKEYPRTALGSKYAVEAFMEVVFDFVNNVDNALFEKMLANKQGEILLQLEKSILKEWHQKVQADIDRHPFSEEELSDLSEKSRQRYESEEDAAKHKAYGTTLIAFVVTDKYAFGVQIGDGSAVVFDKDLSASIPIPEDENCQLNITTSLCDDNAIDEFRHIVFTDNIPVAFFCGTDGIEDSFTSTDELFSFYKGILSVFDKYGYDKTKLELKEYLPVLSQKGSGDDVSIGAIINKSLVIPNAQNPECNEKDDE